MGESSSKVICPSCGFSFEPPGGVARFCMQCGTPIPPPAPAPAEPTPQTPAVPASPAAAPAPQPAYDPQEAARLAAEAARLAQDAAATAQQLSANPPSGPVDDATWQAIDAARASAASMQDVARQAQEFKAAADEQLRLTEEQVAAKQRELELRERELELAEREAELRRREEALRAEARASSQQAAPQPQQAAPAPSQQARPAPAPSPQQQAPSQGQAQGQQAPRQPQRYEYRRNVAVRDGSGRGIYLVTIPTTWSLDAASIEGTGSSSRPFLPHARFSCSPAIMTLRLGWAGSRLSEGMRSLMLTYGGALAGSDRTNYAEVPEPRRLADNCVRAIIPDENISSLYLLEELGSTRTAELQQDALAQFQRTAQASGGAIIKDPFAGELTRIYAFEINGQEWNIAAYVRLCAVKDGSGVDVISPVGLMGSVVGGLFNAGKRAKAKRDAEREAARTGTQVDASYGPAGWCTPDYGSYVRGGTIYWDVAGLATIAAPAEQFEEVYENVFVPLILTYEVHPDLVNMALADARQESAAIQAATNREINAMNMRTEATLAAARQAQAAADARFEAWQRQSDARHAAFRERTNAAFNSSGHRAPDFSEAIRGVNTYTTSDGREVEVDVRYDRAYENQGGDVMGWDSAFDPGSDWTQIPRT